MNRTLVCSQYKIGDKVEEGSGYLGSFNGSVVVKMRSGVVDVYGSYKLNLQ